MLVNSRRAGLPTPAPSQSISVLLGAPLGWPPGCDHTRCSAIILRMLLAETRRTFLFGSLLGSLGALALACRSAKVTGEAPPSTTPSPPQAAAPKAASPMPPQATSGIADLERRIGGRIGVYALATDSGKELAHRADERFAMASTFKWVLAAAILARVDRSEASLEERIAYGPADLLEYAPATREHVAEGSMTALALTEAIVTVSDNTAANLLLARSGGPTGFTEFVRSLGDSVTRLDRTEPTLNSNDPGDPRDTTSPRAMVGLLQKILQGSVLGAASRELLLGWMRASETGKRRLRAGLPSDWLVGDKTGSGARAAVNDVAIATPPGRQPILLAVYLSDSASPLKALEAAHAEVARLVAAELA